MIGTYCLRLRFFSADPSTSVLGTMYEYPSSMLAMRVLCHPTMSTLPSICPTPVANCTRSPSTNGCVTKIKMPPMQLLTSFCAAKPMAMPETPPTARRPDMFTPSADRQ